MRANQPEAHNSASRRDRVKSSFMFNHFKIRQPNKVSPAKTAEMCLIPETGQPITNNFRFDICSFFASSLATKKMWNVTQKWDKHCLSAQKQSQDIVELRPNNNDF